MTVDHHIFQQEIIRSSTVDTLILFLLWCPIIRSCALTCVRQCLAIAARRTRALKRGKQMEDRFLPPETSKITLDPTAIWFIYGLYIGYLDIFGIYVMYVYTNIYIYVYIYIYMNIYIYIHGFYIVCR